MKIAYISTYDARDISNWSGSGYYIARSLRDRSLHINYVGGLTEKYANLFRVKQVLYKLLRQNYLRDREPFILKAYARQAQCQLAKIDHDLIFSPSTHVIAYLATTQPVIFWSDATFAGMVDFYPEFSNLCAETLRNGHRMEQSALDKCKLAIYSSEWAAQSAIKNYQVDPDKVKVVQFGANIQCDRTITDIQNIINRRSVTKCKMLFLGAYWWRKGGDIALKIAAELHKRGLDLELNLVGSSPSGNHLLPNYVNSLGFISKSSDRGKKKIDKLLAESHFLLLPTRAECYGVVLCEASSFAVPSISHKVGGVPSIIKDNINGKLFDLTAKIEDYCDYIQNLFTNYTEYKRMALDSFKEYELRLNWEVAGKTVKDLLYQVL
jgi:glycosyltransferase involved in cell wall biosynthesis